MNSALIFPGQGSQFVGMGKEFYSASPQAKAIFDAADRVIPGLTDVIFNGPPEKLTSTAFCQPAIFTFSVAALEAFKAHPKYKNIHPSFAAGHSLGEVSAICAAEALTFAEALALVSKRAAYMEEATKLKKGTMAAVLGLEKAKVIELCLECEAEAANFNTPEQTVITGEAQAVADAGELMKAHGAKRVIPLDVSGAFHSSLMKPAAEKLKAELAKVHFKRAKFPIVHNASATAAIEPSEIHEHLAQQMTSSVHWVDTVEFMAAKGVTTLFEIGPGSVLKGLVRKINSSLTVYNIQKPEDIEGLPLS